MNLRFSRKQLGIPYAVFLICFVVAPLLVVLYYAFTNGSGQFTAGNFINFFTDENTIGTLCYSLVVAATVTVCCTLVAYPVAYILARSDIKKKNVLLVLFIAPMWINFYAPCGSFKRSADHDGRQSGLSSVPQHGDRYDL